MSPDVYVCAFVTLAFVVSLGVGGFVAAWLSAAQDEREGAASLDLDGFDPRPSPDREDRRRARRQTLDQVLAEARAASDSVMVSRSSTKNSKRSTKSVDGGTRGAHLLSVDAMKRDTQGAPDMTETLTIDFDSALVLVTEEEVIELTAASFECSLQALRALEDQIEADSKFGFDPGRDWSEEYSKAEGKILCGKCELCKEARREMASDA